MSEKTDESPIVSLKPEQLNAAGDMLGRAFCSDAMSEYLFPNPATRQRRIGWMMQRLARFAARYAITETTPELDCLACWFRSDQTQITGMRMLRCGMWASPLRLGLGPLKRFFSMMQTANTLQANLSNEVHWYLQLLAVDPARQGAGLGTRLLLRGLEWADRDGLPCRLETTTPQNVAFYRKHGFEITAEAEIGNSSTKIITMERPTGGTIGRD